MDLAGYLAERTPVVDAHLDAVLPPAGQGAPRLHAAMRHLVFPGGKRLRPAFAFAAAEACGRSARDALAAAAAVELVHTYSLVHDDLPCMDDDDVRRGRPTVHVLFGEATAVLAGDALLALAFEVLAAADAEPACVAACVRDLAATAGAAWLVGGQAADLACADLQTPPDVRHIESVHERKSAALLAAAVRCGARLAGAEAARVDALGASALEVGVAFQIADDWLDRDDDEACSLVRAIGPEPARARAEQLLASALERIEGLGEPALPLRELMRFAVRRSE